MSAVKSLSPTRVASKAKRRQQLIDATIKCVANSGLSGVTMAEITQQAGLSMGIVNLHFESKENLLVETLRFISDEYIGGWRADVMQKFVQPVDKIRGLIEYDFSVRVCNPNKLALWFAFWGEAKSRPTYRRICAAHDRECTEVVMQICIEIAAQERALNKQCKNIDADLTTTAYMALVDGLWLDRLLRPKELSLEKAKRVCQSYFSSVFPGLFNG